MSGEMKRVYISGDFLYEVTASVKKLTVESIDEKSIF